MSATSRPATVTKVSRFAVVRGFAGRRRIEGWLMVAPAILIFLMLGLFPLVYSLVVSFQRRDLMRPGTNEWVGFANYAKAFRDDRVWNALQNTIGLTALSIAIEFVLGLGLALVLIDELRGKRFIIPILVLPVMMVPVIVALIWRMLWDNQYGAINQILRIITGHDVNIVWLLTDKNRSLFAILVTQVWQWMPFMFLILLAGLAGINPDLYEAAALDGASWWQSLRDITLPGLANVIAVAILFRTLDAFKIFDLVFMMTKGQPGTSTETISWYIYDRGRQALEMGYASALSFLFLIFVTILATVYVGRVLKGHNL
ncbi:MAG: sugar ABC transporter permease [Chloroflexota bacterium]